MVLPPDVVSQGHGEVGQSPASVLDLELFWVVGVREHADLVLGVAPVDADIEAEAVRVHDDLLWWRA